MSGRRPAKDSNPGSGVCGALRLPHTSGLVPLAQRAFRAGTVAALDTVATILFSCQGTPESRLPRSGRHSPVRCHRGYASLSRSEPVTTNLGKNSRKHACRFFSRVVSEWSGPIGDDSTLPEAREGYPGEVKVIQAEPTLFGGDFGLSTAKRPYPSQTKRIHSDSGMIHADTGLSRTIQGDLRRVWRIHGD